ncbi:hypothetical protein V1506DRAFT_541322 [Lipomyces tetrasporus]
MAHGGYALMRVLLAHLNPCSTVRHVCISINVGPAAIDLDGPNTSSCRVHPELLPRSTERSDLFQRQGNITVNYIRL